MSILEDRDAFPPGETVDIRVTANFDNDVTFFADVSVGFLPSQVEMVLDPEIGFIIDASAGLVLDFTDSYTMDGVVVGGEWEWEWEWECVVPDGWKGEGEEEGGLGRECTYEGGKQFVMPGREEGRFEGEDGEKLEEGVPLYFVVRARVRREGEEAVVAEGKWSRMLSSVGSDGRKREEGALGLSLVEETWVCEDSSIGYLVCFQFPFFFYYQFNSFLP